MSSRVEGSGVSERESLKTAPALTVPERTLSPETVRQNAERNLEKFRKFFRDNDPRSTDSQHIDRLNILLNKLVQAEQQLKLDPDSRSQELVEQLSEIFALTEMHNSNEYPVVRDSFLRLFEQQAAERHTPGEKPVEQGSAPELTRATLERLQELGRRLSPLVTKDFRGISPEDSRARMQELRDLAKQLRHLEELAQKWQKSGTPEQARNIWAAIRRFRNELIGIEVRRANELPSPSQQLDGIATALHDNLLAPAAEGLDLLSEQPDLADTTRREYADLFEQQKAWNKEPRILSFPELLQAIQETQLHPEQITVDTVTHIVMLWKSWQKLNGVVEARPNKETKRSTRAAQERLLKLTGDLLWQLSHTNEKADALNAFYNHLISMGKNDLAAALLERCIDLFAAAKGWPLFSTAHGEAFDRLILERLLHDATAAATEMHPASPEAHSRVQELRQHIRRIVTEKLRIPARINLDADTTSLPAQSEQTQALEAAAQAVLKAFEVSLPPGVTQEDIEELIRISGHPGPIIPEALFAQPEQSERSSEKITAAA